MLTFIFLAVIGIIVVGFLLWVVAFGGVKRRGQSGQEQVNAQRMQDTDKRSS